MEVEDQAWRRPSSPTTAARASPPGWRGASRTSSGWRRCGLAGRPGRLEPDRPAGRVAVDAPAVREGVEQVEAPPGHGLEVVDAAPRPLGPPPSWTSTRSRWSEIR